MDRRTSAAEVVDLERYPFVGGQGRAAASGIVDCRARLIRDGALVLPGFVRAGRLAALRREAEALVPLAYYCEQRHNPYLAADDPGLPSEHPRNRAQLSDKGCIADDLIPGDSLLRRLYDWAGLRRFIAAVLGVERLYPYEDPLGSLNINVFLPGQQLGWHFDNADFAVTLMLQPALAGGAYEYVPALREPGSENYDAVARVLAAQREGIRTLGMEAGALMLFHGRCALHRVTPVQGRQARLIAVLSYDTSPGKRLTEHAQRLFYGRAA